MSNPEDGSQSSRREAARAGLDPEAPRDSRVHRRGKLGLRPWQLAAVVAGLTAVFVFVDGPIWRHPYEPDLAILLSYAPIPLVVAGVLLGVGRLSVRNWLLDSLLVAVAKFGVIAAILITLWMTQSPPSSPQVTGAGAGGRGTTLVRRLGPSEGAGTPVELRIDETGFTPARLTLHVGQPLAIRATGGGLHTLALVREGTTIFNAPVLSDGRPTRLEVLAPLGTVTARCTVHAESRDEHGAQLTVVP